MTKRRQVTAAFCFGVAILGICIAIAVFQPYPSPFLYFVTRVALALAAAGFAVVLPGLLEVQLNSQVKAAGTLAVFCIIYFFSPADLATSGTPTDVDGVFLIQSSEDTQSTRYYWEQARASFSVPNKRWSIATEAAESGLGDVTLSHRVVTDAQIQMHVSLVDQSQLGSFKQRTVRTYRDNIGQHGGFASHDINIGGQPAFMIDAHIRGQVNGLKTVKLAFLPNSDGRLLELHLTYNRGDAAESELVEDYRAILRSVELADE